ncbi:Glyoxylate/succinic semialdehyde reductase 2 chloroplastic [Bienertia sinuspersici]
MLMTCDVTVWNRTKSKCDPLISLGATYKASPEEVAAYCDVTIAMLADPNSAVRMWILHVGRMELQMGWVQEKGMWMFQQLMMGRLNFCERIKATGASFLEVLLFFFASPSLAPVSGSKKPAEDGQLIFLTAGDQSLYERVAPLLESWERSLLISPSSRPICSMMATFSEGLMLSEKVGLDPSVLVEDLRLALGLAESVSQPIPIAAAANELYKVAKSQGLSDEDFSAVIEALKSKKRSSSPLSTPIRAFSTL